MSTVVWLRRDLRLADNPALAAALSSHQPVTLLFIDDSDEHLGSAEKVWLYHSLRSFSARVARLGGAVILRRGDPRHVLPEICVSTDAKEVFWNRRYEPRTLRVDSELKVHLETLGVRVSTFSGNVLIEPWKIATQSKTPFQVYTPFWKQLRSKIEISTLSLAPLDLTLAASTLPSEDLDTLGLLPSVRWDGALCEHWEIGEEAALERLRRFVDSPIRGYDETRNLPGTEGTSRLSPHLHFGEVSAQRVWHTVAETAKVGAGTETFLKEIAWRDFAHHLLFHFPQTLTEPLRVKFRSFPWVQNHDHFRSWTRGLTGYPIVDAGMRELWSTGWMHNRVRMIVASFLVKHLLIDWRKGAEWFFDTLVDADLASNTLGWQWTAGCGADAAPYFRVFNPTLQGEKFDAKGAYVRQWVPELRALPDRWIHRPWLAPDSVRNDCGLVLGRDYPFPIVDHQEARERALDAFEELSLPA